MMSANRKTGIRALTKGAVGEWLEKKGANKEDVEYLKENNYNGKILDLWNRRNKDILVSSETKALLKQLIEQQQSAPVKVMVIFKDRKKRYDVLSDIEKNKLLELVQKECSDAIDLELCVDEAANRWVVVNDPILLKNKDKLRVIQKPHAKLVEISVHHNGSSVKFDVESSIRLDGLRECIQTKLGCSNIAKLEVYDKDFNDWFIVKKIADVDLASGDIELKVETRPVA